MDFHSILFRTAEDALPLESESAPDFFRDLNLDQIIHAVTADWQEYKLASFFYVPLHDLDAIAYRQEVVRDLERTEIMQAIRVFSKQMRAMRERIAQAEKMEHYPHAERRCFLGAAQIYCEAVVSLAACLEALSPTSRGFCLFRTYLSEYAASSYFGTLSTNASTLTADLAAIRYSILLREGSVTVHADATGTDFSVAVEETFEKFRSAAQSNHWAEPRKWSGMNHIEAQIQNRLALLAPDTFSKLEHFRTQHTDYLDKAIARFDREVQFYIAYFDHIDKMRRRGLAFCEPKVSQSSKEIHGTSVFDLALAGKLLESKASLVTNDFFLKGHERIFVVSGPNQGGKTTFARTMGQLHYLAALGLSVPGTDVQLFLFDRLFTHFEREEDIRNLRGKLQDDLVRIRHILDEASSDSLVIINEIFASTTLQDAVYLGRKIMARISALDTLAVCVTFLDELASFDEKTVSLVSTVDSANPALRTFKLERKPADGLAYALAIAQKYRVTYDQLKERIQS